MSAIAYNHSCDLMREVSVRSSGGSLAFDKSRTVVNLDRRDVL